MKPRKGTKKLGTLKAVTAAEETGISAPVKQALSGTTWRAYVTDDH